MGLQKEQLLQIIDAATVSLPAGKKRPKTRQHTQLKSLGALDGAFSGLLFGMPFFGLAVGAAVGALSGHFSNYGIDDDFIKQVRAKVTEGTSGLFLRPTKWSSLSRPRRISRWSRAASRTSESRS